MNRDAAARDKTEERLAVKALAADFGRLAVFNAEVARGLLHTPAWIARMAAVQVKFNGDLGRRPEKP